jgi:poly(beta-D-mannuronate) lyase
VNPFYSSPRPLQIAALAVLVCSAFSASAATRTASSVAELQASLKALAPGDTLTVKNGTYDVPATLTLTTTGTAAAPITIKAESVGGVTLTGKGGFRFGSPAAYVTVEGFVFGHAAGQTAITAGANHCRITRCVFECTGEGVYLGVSGDDAEVDRNEFRNKKTLGNMISVTGTGSQVARRLHIHHNYFHDFRNAGGNGAETIRFGLSGLSMSTGEGLVEYNLFVRCVGENELISNKSCGNTYRYNTFLESPGAQLTLRHGNDCLVYGNIFRGTDGLRIFGDRHQVFGNYLEGNTRGINLGNGDGEVADGAKLTSHDRPDGCTISFNTLIDNKAQYQMDGRKDGMGATRTTFAHNLIQGGTGKVAAIGGPNTGAVWKGNVLVQAAPAGDLPAEGFTVTDTKLVADASGILRAADKISAGASAVTASSISTAAVVAKDPLATKPMLLRVVLATEVGPASQ